MVIVKTLMNFLKLLPKKKNTARLHQISVCPYPHTSIYTPSSPSGSHMGWASNGAFFGLDSARFVKKEISKYTRIFQRKKQRY